jgi:acetolactate synthase-1/2/3 large subunit
MTSRRSEVESRKDCRGAHRHSPPDPRPPTSDSIRAGEAAVRLLRERGVRYAFGVPGESFLGLLDAIQLTPGMTLVPTRHEGGAAFMAEAVGKLTGAPAICMGTRGVGSANLAIGLHTAYQDSTPLIALVGQVETDFRHREALQEVELAAFLGEITKWAVEAPNGARLPEIAAEAWRRSVTGRPGPVAVALRGDLLDEPVPDEPIPPTALPVTGVRASDAAAIVDALAAAQAPLIIAGGGLLRARATAALVELAERLAVPVMSTFRRPDVFPNDHPLYLGPLSFGAPASVAARARDADVVLALGTRLGELTTLGYALPGPRAMLIHVDIAPEVLGRTFPARIAIAADVAELIASLLAVPHDPPAAERIARNARDRETYVAGSTPPDGPEVGSRRSGASSVATSDFRPPTSDLYELIDPARVVAELQRQLPPEAIRTCDAGNFWGWIARYYRFTRPGTFLGPTSGAMGYAVPAAVAAALVSENRVPVVALAGDGGFLMTGSELAVAAQLGLKLTCVIFDNALYGTIRLHQERAYPGRVAGTELWSPDFVRYAEAFGGIGVRVERDDEIAEALATALAHPGIAVVSIAVSREMIAVGTRLSEVGAG